MYNHLYWQDLEEEPEKDRPVLVYFGQDPFEVPYKVARFQTIGDNPVWNITDSSLKTDYESAKKWSYIEGPGLETNFTDPKKCPLSFKEKSPSIFDIIGYRRSPEPFDVIMGGLFYGMGRTIAEGMLKSSSEKGEEDDNE